jgi:hypothetical protein
LAAQVRVVVVGVLVTVRAAEVDTVVVVNERFQQPASSMLNSWLKTDDVMECCLVVSVLCFGTQNHFDGESSLPSTCFCCVSSHCFSWCTSTLQAVSRNALSGSSNGFQSTGVSATTGSPDYWYTTATLFDYRAELEWAASHVIVELQH